ncbi:MAG TPA: hypothetical protein VGF06_08300, partial [Terriglobales bacterium]
MDTIFTYRALWFLHPALQFAVAAVMVWRRLHTKFPVFFVYVVAQVAIFGVVFSLYEWGSDYAYYFFAYWICSAINLVIGFKVIHEIFLDVFRPYHALKDLGSVLFKWAGLVMVLVGVVVAAASPALSAGPAVEAILIVQRCVRVIQIGLILFLVVFSDYVGVSWRQRSFGIALGFGAFATVELLVVTLRAGGYLSLVTGDLTNMAAYNVSILIWLGYCVVKSPLRQMTGAQLKSQRWDHTLADIQRPVAPDSLIPMFESMVDRAFSRTHINGGLGNGGAEPAAKSE